MHFIDAKCNLQTLIESIAPNVLFHRIIQMKKSKTVNRLSVPKSFTEFSDEFPGLAKAWDILRKTEEQSGPLDEKTRRLIKLGIAIGSRQQGAVTSAVRKAIAAGATKEEIYQVITLSASTIGMPSTVAIYTWTKEILSGTIKK